MSVRLHPAAWIAWAAATAATVLSLTNPVLIAVALVALGFVAVTMAPDRGPFALMLKIGFVALAARTVLFALTGHPSGAVLFTTPQLRLPTVLGGFTLGGPVAGPVVVASAIEGLRLAALLACFGVVLSVVEATRIVRLMPRFLFEAGLVVAIGVSFVPTLVRTARDVREAQRIRGERVRGVRALTLAVPVLATTLERAVTVAESMEGRGYGRAVGAHARDEARARAAAFAGVAALSGGGLLATAARVPAGWVLAAAGAGLLGFAVARLSSLSARTRYRRDRLRAHDTAIVVVAGIVAAVSLAFGGGWRYHAYPAVTAPDVPLAGVLAVAAIAAPVAIAALRARRLRAASRPPAPSDSVSVPVASPEPETRPAPVPAPAGVAAEGPA